MNIVHLSGALTRDPEVREINSGDRTTKVVNFTVASSRRFKKKDGTTDEETTFINCEAWDSGAETISKWFNKGDSIIIHGSLKNETWEDKDGNKRYRDKVRVANFEFPPRGRKKDDEENSSATTSVAATASTASSSDDADGDIPF
jgi:single-strand DNA-binding protein